MLRRRARGGPVVPVDPKKCDTCDALRKRRKRSDRTRVVERGLTARQLLASEQDRALCEHVARVHEDSDAVHRAKTKEAPEGASVVAAPLMA